MSNNLFKQIDLNTLDNCLIPESQSLVLMNYDSSEKDSKLQETPYFDQFDSGNEKVIFKNSIEFQNSVSIKPYQLQDQWSVQQKVNDDVQQNEEQKKEIEQIEEEDDNENSIDYKDQIRKQQKLEDQNNENKTCKREKDEMNISYFKPEIFYPTVQRQFIKKTEDIIEHQVTFQEIKRIENSKKRSHHDTERLMHFRDQTNISIGGILKCDYVINDFMKSISKNHAQLLFDSDKQEWLIIDQSSTNGTYIIKEEIILELNMELLIGTFIGQVKNIQIDQNYKIIDFYFYNIVDQSIPSFSIEFKFEKYNTKPQFIGKKYQNQFKEDMMMQDHHCSIQTNSNFDIVLKNIESIYDQVGIQLKAKTPYKLSNETIFKFGFINKYKLIITQNETEIETTFSKKCSIQVDTISIGLDGCILCTEKESTLYFLKPCNHQILCINCIVVKSNNICPQCNSQIIDFNCTAD